MRNNIKLKCIVASPKGEFNIGKIYEAYSGWYDADEGETEMRVYDNIKVCRCFRDYEWLQYFEEI